MSKFAELTVNGNTYQLPLVEGTEGEVHRVQLLFLMEKKEFSGTEDTASKTLPANPASWK